MTRDEARTILLAGGWLNVWDGGTYMYYNNLQGMCATHLEYLQEGSEYTCCEYFYNDVEQMLNSIEESCKGDWNEVSE